MPRSTRVVLPASLTEQIVRRLRQVKEIGSLTLERGSGVAPAGDVITVESTTRQLPEIMRILQEEGVLAGDGASVSTTEPSSLVVKSEREAISSDVSDASFEEMDSTIAKEANMTLNALLLMAAAGIIASIALLSDAVHLIVGAATIAPAYEPLSRISLGIVGQSTSWRNGLVDTLKAYTVLIAAALLTAVIYDFVKPSNYSYLSSGSLIAYWSTVSGLAACTAAAAGFAGGVLIATKRSVLTVGLMVALALIPGGALVGIGIARADWSLAGTAATRTALEAGIVIVTSFLVFAWKRIRVQRRRMS